MVYGIIGMGNTGKAAAAYLTAKGQKVLCWNRSSDKCTQLAANGLTATGQIEGQFKLQFAATPADLAARCDVIMIFTVASGHLSVAKLLAGHLQKGQIVLITNCCWGAVEFDEVLGKEAAQKDVLIAETNGQLILCNSPTADSVYLKTIKRSMLLACTVPCRTGEVLARLQSDWPQFVAASNVFETSLSGTNPVAHGPLALFNLARIENEEDYRLFADGMSAKTAAYMAKIDAERIAVASACGVTIHSALNLLNSSWPQKQDTLYDVFHQNPSYLVTKGITGLNHRYITEDLPYGLAPLCLLARRYGLKTPYLDALLNIFSLTMDADYLAQAPRVDSVDLARYCE